MSRKRLLLIGLVVLFVFAVATTALYAQVTTGGTVTGTVRDPSKAVIPDADLTLARQGTNITQTTVSNGVGLYVFPAIAAGDYTLRCSAKGFRTAEVKQVHVEVLKTVTIDFTLELGMAAQIVEVSGGGLVELSTTDASIGSVIGGDPLKYLPAQARSITALVLLQPAVSPSICGNRCENGGQDTQGGQVAGALTDQSTFYVDGGDATSDLEGTNNYVAPPGEPQPAPFIAVPAETVQEFRVVTASSTASFSRSQGAEVGVVTKSGTNAIHGSAYEYYYGNALRGNDWVNNSIGRPQPHSVNNRFGASGSGAIIKDKLFIYGNYEGRRFRSPFIITTAVPTPMARQGILRFRDCASGFDSKGNCLGGNIVSFNLNPNVTTVPFNTGCASATGACDPRSIGVSPLILNYFNLLPPGNNPSFGDGLNSIGLTQSYAKPVNEDLAVTKIDYNISRKWSLFGTYHYNRYRLTTTEQFNATADKLISATPVEPRLVTFQLTGQISPYFTSQTHGSFMRDWWGWNRAPVVPQLAGTDAALMISGENRIASGFIGATRPKIWADPTNLDTQNARSRLWFGRDWFVAQDSTWVRGAHTLQFGGAYWFWNLVHSRTDVVTGGLTLGPEYFVGEARSTNGGSFLGIPATARPATCAPASPTAPAVTTNCLQSGDLTRWNATYATLLGLVDRATQVGTRDGNFIASPLGSPLIDHVHTESFDSYIMDSWKMKPSITLTYGLSYGVQFPPHELNGKQVLQVFGANNQPLSDLNAFFQARNAALSSGGFFASSDNFSADSTFGFSPIRHIPGRNSSATTSWNNFGPRVAVAWNVPFDNKLFGNKQTVIRAGYSILWNRTSAVGEVLTPLLGNGLASVDQCAGPTFTAGSTTATCSGARTDPSTGFRIGTDGNTVPIPAFTNASIPLVSTRFLGVSRAAIADPALSTPYSHNVTVDIQRAFRGNWFVDVGYIGRFSRNIWTNADINATDPFAKDPTSGQTLAQAFDCLSLEARSLAAPPGLSCNTPAGTTTATSGFTPQPFFENPTYGCPGCTLQAAMADRADLINGSLSGFMLLNYDFGVGCSAGQRGCFNPNPGQARPLDPMQIFINNMTTDGGRANYNALFISLRKSTASWTMNVNYTWSHSISNIAGTGNYVGQQYTFYSPPTPFDFNTGTASANGDRRHVFNASWYYLLPFGKGRRFAAGNAILGRILGGWYSSGVWTMETGLPQCILANGDYGALNGSTCAVGTSFFGKTGRHDAVLGASGIGTATKTGINLFENPAAVYNSLSRPLLSRNSRPVQEQLNLANSWNMDLSFGKNIAVTERYRVVFAADFFNVFNHPIFCTTPFGVNCGANLDLNKRSSFGVATGADNAPRQVQLGLRFEF